MLEPMGGREARCWRGVVMITVGEAFGEGLGVGIVDMREWWSVVGCFLCPLYLAT